ncbi:hypothetical protein ACWEOG_21925 [Amycolatopsis japonica]
MNTQWSGLIDDAVMFPPGNAALRPAVDAHIGHRMSWYGPLIGPFVLPGSRVGELEATLAGRPIDLSLSYPNGLTGLVEALTLVAELDHVTLSAVEVAIPSGVTAEVVVSLLEGTLPDDVAAFIEVPRDARQTLVLDVLADSAYEAKLRTGGFEADDYPTSRELAATILGCSRRLLPFKATAGLHHAVRNTDPETRFQQHGFLNILLATDAADNGAELSDLIVLLDERDRTRVADSVRGLGPRLVRVRDQFLSIGARSIEIPVHDLLALELLNTKHGRV